MDNLSFFVKILVSSLLRTSFEGLKEAFLVPLNDGITDAGHECDCVAIH
jgi:hypothetical protein